MAGPASASKLSAFSATGTGYVLRVTLDVRPLIKAVPALQPVLDTVWSAVPGQSGKFPGVIDQTFIETSSDADGVNHVAKSTLAHGLLNLDSVKASKIGQNVSKVVQTLQVPSADLPLVNGAIGTLKAAVATGPGVNGSGVLEKVGVDLGLDKLPTSVLNDLVSQLTATVSDLSDQVSSTLTGALGSSVTGALSSQVADTIDGMASSLTKTSPVIGQLTSGLGLSSSQLTDSKAVSSAVTDLLDVSSLTKQITDALNASLLKGALAEMKGLINFTKAVRTGNNVAMADSAATLKTLNVLGGLVDVRLLDIKSHSEAAGFKGSAKNSSYCRLADVKVGGDALALSLDGKNIYINGAPVPVVGSLVGTIKGVADQVLNVLGVSVKTCDVAQTSAEPDGSAAAQRVSALRVSVAPLGLFSLVIDPTVQTQAAAQLASVRSVSLPHTGAAPLATVMVGLGLAGAAIFLRKRFA